MDVHDYKITDSFTDALDTICKHCTKHGCFMCGIFELRLNAESQAHAEQDINISYYRGCNLPKMFAFQTNANRLTKCDIYYAKRDGNKNQYTVTLPRVGCVYHFSVEHIQKQIMDKNYIIVSEKE